MFVVSVKVSAFRAACVVLGLSVIVAVAAWPRGNIQASVTLGRQVAGISSNEKRVQFIESYGWKVDATPVEVVEITVPQSFNRVYRNYNSIQKEQGFDLSEYRGERVKRWTYRITNYPGTTDEVHINLLICKDAVIGGDVSTVAMNGFMHGFSLPDTSGSAASGTQTGVKPSAANIVSGVVNISGL